MSPPSREILGHLQEVVDLPDLAGTRYAVLRLLGRGGMGSVYLAHDAVLDREVALKVLSDPDPDGSLGARLAREARILARLEHPGIVPVHDAGTLPDGRTFYVMKHVSGLTVDAWVAGKPDLAERLRLFLGICDAVAFAHAHGVIHRDLKPGNLMVGAYGEALVLDWGVAREPAGSAAPATGTGRQAGTGHGAVVGTPSWMAPEQARGEPATPRSDVYSLGRVLALLAGDGPRPLAAIAARATDPAPDLRYPGIAELAGDVRSFLAGAKVTAHRETAADRLRRLARPHALLIALVLAYLLMRAGILLAAGL